MLFFDSLTMKVDLYDEKVNILEDFETIVESRVFAYYMYEQMLYFP